MSYRDQFITTPTRAVGLRSNGQVDFVKTIRNYDVTLGHGPAGTGKTFLAVAAALEALHKKQVNKIILTRPAVEAGEKLGYLPGDFDDKVMPYLRPLFDALRKLVKRELIEQMQTDDILEISPLAYMRGRTFDKTFMILDEAQNTTPVQMKMFLTRMGQDSKVIAVGDTTQVDLQSGKDGLSDALHRLDHTSRIGLIRLDKTDIQRHPVVQDIVDAYETE